MSAARTPLLLGFTLPAAFATSPFACFDGIDELALSLDHRGGIIVRAPNIDRLPITTRLFGLPGLDRFEGRSVGASLLHSPLGVYCNSRWLTVL